METFCRQFYEPVNALQQKEAERALIAFVESSDCLQKCQVLLERGQVEYFYSVSLIIV